MFCHNVYFCYFMIKFVCALPPPRSNSLNSCEQHLLRKISSFDKKCQGMNSPPPFPQRVGVGGRGEVAAVIAAILPMRTSAFFAQVIFLLKSA